jgi:hypothetical protein
MHASATNLRFTIDARRAEVNNGALQIYVIVKSVARNPLSTTATAYVANLKRDLGRTGIGRKKKETIPAAPAPTTPAPAGGGHHAASPDQHSNPLGNELDK